MPNSEDDKASWRFSMELLHHVHQLRVLLLPSSSQVQPARDCANLEATIVSGPLALACSWKSDDEAVPHSLRLPLPVLLFDYSSSPRVSALEDCVQLSLYLLPFPSVYLFDFSSISLNDTGSTDIFGNAPNADCRVLDVMKESYCKDNDCAHRIHEKSGTCNSLQFPVSAEEGIHYDDFTVQNVECDCTHAIVPPSEVCVCGGMSSGEQGAQQAACRDYGCVSSVNHENKGVYDDNVHQSVEHIGADHKIRHNAIPRSNDHVCDSNVMDIVNTFQAVREDFPYVVHLKTNDCDLEQLALRHPMSFQRCSEESEAHRHLTHDDSNAIETSEGSSLGQHAHVANKGPLHGQSYELARGFEDHSSSQGTAIFLCKNCLTKVSRNPVRNFVELPCFDWREVAENWFGTCCCSFSSTAEFLSASFERSLQLHPGKCLVGPSTFYLDFSDVVVTTESAFDVTIESTFDGNKINMRQLPTPCFLAVGNGFMVWENQQSKNFKWLSVHCTSCASLIGAYPSTNSGSSREGLHLFQCQVISCKSDGTLYDAYRCKTFKDLLVKEFRERTDENTSHRFLVRSLMSEVPLLQLVVLNYDSLICTGRVCPDMADRSWCTSTGLPSEVELQRSIKVLFLDCTRFLEDDARYRPAELWAKEHDAETVFMCEEFVDKLRDELLTNNMFCPVECGLFQSFMGSFLYTT